MVRNYWGQDRAYHHTAPINMNYGLHEALRIVLEEGLENRFARHARNHKALKAGLKALGIEYSVAEPNQLPMLNSVLIPVRSRRSGRAKELLAEFGIEIGSGLGPLKGKTWRIGLMGETSTAANVLLFLAALERCLTARSRNGAGVAAANAFYAAGRRSEDVEDESRSLMPGMRFRIEVVPRRVVDRDLPLWRIAVVHVVELDRPLEVVRVIDVRIIVEPLPVGRLALVAGNGVRGLTLAAAATAWRP